MRCFPRGVTKKNHGEIRDGLLSQLLLLGIDVPGDWEDWCIKPTGATESQKWGSPRTSMYDRNMEWWLIYKGESVAGQEQSKKFGSREKARDCLLTKTMVKRWVVTEEYGDYERFVGHEFTPPDQEERGIDVGTRRIRVVTYKCAKCGMEFTRSRRYGNPMSHSMDDGELVFVSSELIKR